MTVSSCGSETLELFQISPRPLAFVSSRIGCHLSSDSPASSVPKIRANTWDIRPEHDDSGTSVLYQGGECDVEWARGEAERTTWKGEPYLYPEDSTEAWPEAGAVLAA
jgi:hypothetical protein